MARKTQSGPTNAIGLKAKGILTFQVVPSSLGGSLTGFQPGRTFNRHFYRVFSLCLPLSLGKPRVEADHALIARSRYTAESFQKAHGLFDHSTDGSNVL